MLRRDFIRGTLASIGALFGFRAKANLEPGIFDYKVCCDEHVNDLMSGNPGQTRPDDILLVLEDYKGHKYLLGTMEAADANQFLVIKGGDDISFSVNVENIDVQNFMKRLLYTPWKSLYINDVYRIDNDVLNPLRILVNPSEWYPVAGLKRGLLGDPKAIMTWGNPIKYDIILTRSNSDIAVMHMSEQIRFHEDKLIMKKLQAAADMDPLGRTIATRKV